MANSSGTTHIVGPLAEAQARAGCIVSVLCVEKGNEAAILPDPELVESRCFAQTASLNNPGISVRFARNLNRKIQDFDIVHVHAIWNFPSWWAMRAARRAYVPYVVAPQGSFDPWAMRQNPWGKKLYGNLTEVPLLRRAAGFQALTDKEARQIRGFGIVAPCEVIPNGIDESLLQRSQRPDPAYFGLPEDCTALLFLSRIHPKKGLDLLLSAAEIVRDNHPEARFVVAGGDAGSGYLKEIESQCLRRGLSERFVFLDEVRGERKLEVLSCADAFILPSRSEGLPVAALEALAAGLPVVVTNECNLPEVEGLRAGYVVPPEAPRLAGAIQQLLALSVEQRREMGRRARKLAGETFTWPRIATHTVHWYRRIIDGETRH